MTDFNTSESVDTSDTGENNQSALSQLDIQSMLGSFDDTDSNDSEEHEDLEEGSQEDENNQDAEFNEDEEDLDGNGEEGEFEEEDYEEEEEYTPTELSDETEITLENGDVLSLAELKQGQLRYADYTRKTQELAAARKEIEDNATIFKPMVQTMVEQMEKAITQAGGWDAIRSANPEQAQAFSERYIAAKQQLEAINKHTEKFKQEKEQKEAAELLQRRKEMVQGLQLAIPNLSQQTLNDINEYGIEQGLSEDFFNTVDNSHLLHLIYKAMLSDKARSRKSQTQEDNNKAKSKVASKSSPKGKNINLHGNTVNKQKREVNKLKGGAREDALRSMLADLD